MSGFIDSEGCGESRGFVSGPRVAQIQQPSKALLAQKDRQSQPVLHPQRLDGAIWFNLDIAPRKTIVASIRKHFDGPWKNITSVHEEVIFRWWGEFVQAFFWENKYNEDVYWWWYKIAGTRLRDMISKAKVANKRPAWISEDVWNALLDCWNNDEGKRKSRIASANRLSSRDGLGPHAHTAGARSYERVKDNIRKNEGIEPSFLRVLRATHQKRDGTYVDGRAQLIDEELQRQIAALSRDGNVGSTSQASLTPIQEDELYLKTVQPNRGRIFGLGTLRSPSARCKSSASIVAQNVTLMRTIEELNKKLSRVENNSHNCNCNCVYPPPPPAEEPNLSPTDPFVLPRAFFSATGLCKQNDEANVGDEVDAQDVVPVQDQSPGIVSLELSMFSR